MASSQSHKYQIIYGEVFFMASTAWGAVRTSIWWVF